MNKKILLVDDDNELLLSFKRQYRKEFEIITAISGDEGLIIANSKGPFSVVISDMDMPRMNGIQFLSKMETQHKNTVRIMLTGKGDFQIAINAINQGNIFKFLEKPCLKETFIRVVNLGIQQYQLITAEKELLEKTLNGSINLLVEMMNLASPISYQRVTRSKKYVNHIISELKLENGWIYNLAMTLSQIGHLALPNNQLEIKGANPGRSSSNQLLYSEQNKIGRKLLENIPRLENIAAIIEYQKKPFTEFRKPMTIEDKIIHLGAQMLLISFDFNDLVVKGNSYNQSIALMEREFGKYNPTIINALKSYYIPKRTWVTKVVKVPNLKVGMEIDEDIHTRDGTLFLCKGQEVTITVFNRLNILYSNSAIQDDIQVLIYE